MNVPRESSRWWDDEDFQDRLLSLIINDFQTLKSCASLLKPNDFRPVRGMKNGRSRWMVAERALNHYQKHQEPLGRLLRADVLEYAAEIGYARVGELEDYLDLIQKVKPETPDLVSSKVVKFKSQSLKAAAVQELIDLQAAGKLTDEAWKTVSQKALIVVNNSLDTTNYNSTFALRTDRRSRESRLGKIPWTFIEPLDSLVRTVGFKQLGMVLAPYKRGKSIFLEWLAVAFALQRLNVLYVTLEDARTEVEDRLDSIVTRIPIKRLGEFPKLSAKKFARYLGMVRAQIEIYDGTEGGTTVDKIESVVQHKRDQGFITHALLIDYDDHIEPAQHYKEKRFESDEKYRNLQTLMARRNLIGWTAAQTQRDCSHLKILSGDRVAEDIGKMRKVTCGISLGKGDWADDAIYLWVAAHKTDRMEVGCEILPDKERMLIYDHERTYKATKEHAKNNGKP